MFCNKCGLAIPDDSITCSHCGKPAISGQPEVLQSPYFKPSVSSKGASNYKKDDFDDLNMYLQSGTGYKSLSSTVITTDITTEKNEEPYDKPIQEMPNNFASNRPLYIAIVIMISLILLSVLSLVVRLALT